MALRNLGRRNYSGKWLVNIKYQNLQTFKEGLILLCQSILETRRITHLHGSSHFTIPLKHIFFFMRLTTFWLSVKDNMLGREGSRIKSLSTTLLLY